MYGVLQHRIVKLSRDRSKNLGPVTKKLESLTFYYAKML